VSLSKTLNPYLLQRCAFSDIFCNCKSLWIKASAKWINKCKLSFCFILYCISNALILLELNVQGSWRHLEMWGLIKHKCINTNINLLSFVARVHFLSSNLEINIVCHRGQVDLNLAQPIGILLSVYNHWE